MTYRARKGDLISGIFILILIIRNHFNFLDERFYLFFVDGGSSSSSSIVAG